MKNTIAVISIAGSDPSAGAGIQGDIKTFSALGTFGLTAITTITAQNTQKLLSTQKVNKQILYDQLHALFSDFDIKAAKIGVIPNIDIAETIIPFMKKYKLIPWIIDPVMQTSVPGKKFSNNKILTNFLKKYIFPLSSLITPNIPELIKLTNNNINSEQELKLSAKTLYNEINTPILIKGGHSQKQKENVKDILYNGKSFYYYNEKRINKTNTHGTGCALSSAITSYMAKNYSLKNAIKNAKIYVTNAIKYSYTTGKGNGSINHFWNIKT